MAAGAALKKINARVKKLAKRFPKKSRKTLQKQAGAEYRAGKLKAKRKKVSGVRKTVRRAKRKVKRAVRRAVGVTRRKRRTARRAPAKVIIMKVGATKRRRRRAAPKRKAVRRRRVSGVSRIAGIKTSTLLMAGLGIGAIYLLTRRPQVQYGPTGNAVRDSKAQQILNYAVAAGATASAIANLLKSLQNKSDAQIDADYSAAQSGQLMIA
jgi:hypothetical protein